MHQPFDHIRNIGTPCPAKIADGRGIGQRHPPAAIDRRYAVSAGKAGDRVAYGGCRRRWRHVRADLCDPVQAHRKKFSARIQRKFAVNLAAPAVVIRQKGFGARRNPFHRPPGGARRQHGHAVFGVTHAATAKTAADIARDDLELIFGHPRVTRQLHAQHVRALHTGMHGIAFAGRIVGNQARARLHRAGHDARTRQSQTRDV